VLILEFPHDRRARDRGRSNVQSSLFPAKVPAPRATLAKSHGADLG
jgi:hypothetical protein